MRTDAEPAVGSVTESVQVTGANASSIETDSASINAVHSANDAVYLPMNSRAGGNGTSGLSLIGTLPAVQSDQGTFALQGGLPLQVEVQVDGITIQSAMGNSPFKMRCPRRYDSRDCRGWCY